MARFDIQQSRGGGPAVKHINQETVVKQGRFFLSRLYHGDRVTITGDAYGSRPNVAKGTSDKGEPNQLSAAIAPVMCAVERPHRPVGAKPKFKRRSEGRDNREIGR